MGPGKAKTQPIWGSGLELPHWCCFCGSTDFGTHVGAQRVISGCESSLAAAAVTPLMARAGLAGLEGGWVSPSCFTAPRAPTQGGLSVGEDHLSGQRRIVVWSEG